MKGRPLISYDDITLPYDSQPSSTRGPPPAKKAKKANSNKATRSVQEASRELTHEEIWDDSALINAWDAAMEEYEALNGPDKKWKKEPAFKSPLWYNIPPSSRPSNKDFPEHDKVDPSSSTLSNGVEEEEGGYPYHDREAEEETAAGNDNQFHDEEIRWPGYDSTFYDLETASGSMSTVSQDEAFSRALNAMYWGGYWTAVYHCHRNVEKKKQQPSSAQNDAEGGGDTDAYNEAVPN